MQRLPRQLAAKQASALARIVGFCFKLASHPLLISTFEVQLSHHLYHRTGVQGFWYWLGGA
ncbi:hypothetical protein CRN80_24940 [Pseudomonas sp. FDAARGOS_380]|nr:hypothetical protein CRN80_24940 [Pseudomonas sp. FDAARGOS_380]